MSIAAAQATTLDHASSSNDDQAEFRLLTRSDFDGLVSAVLLRHLGKVNEIVFVHPNDMQNGLVEVSDKDISANLPYVPGIYLAFDHHASEGIRNDETSNHILEPHTPSAARVIWNHYGGHSTFPREWDEMMAAVDKSDAAKFSRDEVLYPQGWVLLNFIMDARTGLGRFRDFRISNYDLMMSLIDACAEYNIDEILNLADVKERTELYEDQQFQFLRQLDRCSTIKKNLVTIDLRNEEQIHAGNRFAVYALNSQCNISMYLAPGRTKGLTMISVGKSIFNRSSTANVGALMLEQGGGGHNAVGTCQVTDDRVDEVCSHLESIIVEAERRRR